MIESKTTLMDVAQAVRRLCVYDGDFDRVVNNAAGKLYVAS